MAVEYLEVLLDTVRHSPDTCTRSLLALLIYSVDARLVLESCSFSSPVADHTRRYRSQKCASCQSSRVLGVRCVLLLGR